MSKKESIVILSAFLILFAVLLYIYGSGNRSVELVSILSVLFVVMIVFTILISAITFILKLKKGTSEKDLIEKSTYLDSILRSSIDIAIAVTDLDLTIRFYNPAAEKIFGYKQSEVLGKTVMEMHLKEKVNASKLENAIEIVKKEGLYHYTIAKDTDTGTQYIDSRISTILDTKQNITGYLLMAKNITEQVNARLELEKSKNRYKTFVESTKAILWEMNLEDMRFSYVSSQALEILGYPLDTWKDFQSWAGFIHPLDQNEIVNYRLQAIDKTADHRQEYRMIAKNQKTIWVREHVDIVYIGDKAETMRGFLIDITEQKETELELRESKERLADAQRIAHVGNWEWDLENEKIYWSDEVYRIFGTTPQFFEATYDTFLGFIPNEDKELVKRSICEALFHRKSYDIEHRIIINNTTRYVYELAEVSLDADGNPIKIFGIMQDITERKKAAEALKQSYDAMTTIMDSFNSSVYVTDMETYEILFVNQYIKNISGIENLIGQTCRDMFHRSRLGPCINCSNNRIIDKLGTPTGAHIWEYNNTQSHKWYQYHNEAIRWIDDRIVRITFVKDISEFKEYEEKLKLSNTVFNNTIEGIMVTNTDGVIELVNPAFTTITGFTAEEALGQNPNIMTSGHQPRKFYKKLWDDIINKGTWAGEIWNRRKNGELYPEWLSISSIKNQHGVTIRYAAIFSDITKRKEYDELIKHKAFHDALTDLPNRQLINDRLNLGLVQSERNNLKLAIFFIDLDGFKNVNDSHGHNVGDSLLREVAHRLQEILRKGDTVGRFGGDEFTVISPGITNIEDIHKIAKKISSSIGQDYFIDDLKIKVGSSIGISIFPDHGDEADDLMTKADMAMYYVKQHGKNHYRIWTKE